MLRDLFSLFPAYAGVIATMCFTWTRSLSFPRIRGGDRLFSSTLRSVDMLFPAYAGVIAVHILYTYFHNPFPRIRGGDRQ